MLKYEKKLPPSQAIDVSRQILCALEYAHGNGVIHRDIKPANIMLTHQGQVKVADFGIAKLDTSELTSAGVVIGTPSYMSPEGRQGRAVDAKSDLYATGLVLYEMLSGLRPLPNQDLIPTLRINLYEMARDQQVIDQLYDLLMRVLEERPEARVQTARDFIADLDRIKLPEEEDTGENTLVRTLVNVQAQLPQPPTADEAPASPQQTGDTFTPAVLEPILRDLTRLLGPMAQRALKRAAQTSPNLEALIETLAQEIPNETERKQFIARMGKREATGSGTGSGKQKTGEGSGSAGATPGVRLLLPDEKIVQLSKLLAEYVGPLATHISRRAVAQSASWSDLGGELARHIPNESEQATFLKRFQVLETQ
jgi:serine/threonine-protein kinase